MNQSYGGFSSNSSPKEVMPLYSKTGEFPPVVSMMGPWPRPDSPHSPDPMDLWSRLEGPGAESCHCNRAQVILTEKI